MPPSGHEKIGNGLSIVGKILLEQCLIKALKKSVWTCRTYRNVAISYKQVLQLSDELAVI
jgi:hypothetical protein